MWVQHCASLCRLYSIYEDVLLGLKPTLIVTQSLCSVCSIDLVVVERVVARSKLEPKPVIINLNPQSLQVRTHWLTGTHNPAQCTCHAYAVFCTTSETARRM